MKVEPSTYDLSMLTT